MHRSQLGGLIIDCQTSDLAEAAAFWAAALGLKRSSSKVHTDDRYVELETRPEDVYVEVQKVEHPSRVHLDIETDDIEAEVRRLESLGAKRVAAIRSFVVMEAPTGQRFCVVNVERANFENCANTWE